MYLEKCLDLVRHLKPAFSTETGIPYNIVNLKKVSLFLFSFSFSYGGRLD